MHTCLFVYTVGMTYLCTYDCIYMRIIGSWPYLKANGIRVSRIAHIILTMLHPVTSSHYKHTCKQTLVHVYTSLHTRKHARLHASDASATRAKWEEQWKQRGPARLSSGSGKQALQSSDCNWIVMAPHLKWLLANRRVRTASYTRAT